MIYDEETQKYINKRFNKIDENGRRYRLSPIISPTYSKWDKQSLLIYCKKNQADMILPENVEVKKIPKDLLGKCNFESEVQE